MPAERGISLRICWRSPMGAPEPAERVVAQCDFTRGKRGPGASDGFLKENANSVDKPLYKSAFMCYICCRF